MKCSSIQVLSDSFVISGCSQVQKTNELILNNCRAPGQGFSRILRTPLQWQPGNPYWFRHCCIQALQKPTDLAKTHVRKCAPHGYAHIDASCKRILSLGGAETAKEILELLGNPRGVCRNPGLRSLAPEHASSTTPTQPLNCADYPPGTCSA